MSQCFLEIFQHHIPFGRRFHSRITFPYHIRHFPLTHECTDNLTRCRHICPYPFQNLCKVRRTAAKTSGAEKEYLFVFQCLQKFTHLAVTGTFICPESRKNHICGICCNMRRAAVDTIQCGQCLTNGFCQFSCISCSAAVTNGIFHIIFRLSHKYNGYLHGASCRPDNLYCSGHTV